MGNKCIVFLSRNLETKVSEYNNLVKRHDDGEIKILRVQLLNFDTAINKIDIIDSEFQIAEYYDLSSGDIVEITPQGIKFKYRHKVGMVPPYLYDAITYVGQQ